MTSIDSMLSERGARYGSFQTHAEHTQAIKRLLVKLMGQDKWLSLHDDQRESLEMIAHKLGRITNGDPNYDDSWRDIAGYADLVAKRLAQPEVKPKKTPHFKIGDKVRIASTIDAELYGSTTAGFEDDMAKYLGSTGVVIGLDSDDATAQVRAKDGEVWWWRAEDLTPAANETEDKANESETSQACKCPACTIRRLLQADEVVIAVESKDDAQDNEQDGVHSFLEFLELISKLPKKS